MSRITTHVLDIAHGAARRATSRSSSSRHTDGGWLMLAERRTDADGRVRDLLAETRPAAGRYRITFGTGEYFRAAEWTASIRSCRWCSRSRTRRSTTTCRCW